MKRPTVLELEAVLRRTAVDLLTSANILMCRDADEASVHSNSPYAPVWSVFAEQAFEALEVLGLQPGIYTSYRRLRPWVGES